MGKSIEIERLEGRGITAKITDTGKQFTTYYKFADAAGYSDATRECGKEKELEERAHETFKVLAKGWHESEYRRKIYIIESNDGKRFLVGKDGLDIFENEGETSSLESRNQVEELIAEMRRQAYAEGYERGKFDAKMTKVATTMATAGVSGHSVREFIEESWRETAQERRDEIVKRAKKDIEDLKPDDIIHEGKYYPVNGKKAGRMICRAEFIVNSKKRTVVSIMRGWASDNVYARGIAKCSPEDCFNEYIGKIIALRRALGLKIPYDYVFTPQPTEVRVGNIVRSELATFEVAKVYGNHAISIRGGYAPKDSVKVVDDSNSEEEGE